MTITTSLRCSLVSRREKVGNRFSVGAGRVRRHQLLINDIKKKGRKGARTWHLEEIAYVARQGNPKKGLWGGRKGQMEESRKPPGGNPISRVSGDADLMLGKKNI